MRIQPTKRIPMIWLALGELGLFLLFGSAGNSGFAQAAPQANPYGAPDASETPRQLQQLVAPVALYPDNLVASILAASTYPAQISDANNWLQSHRNLSPQELAAEANNQPWDSSVKALLPFPPVLQNMASNLSWTSELGDASTNQQADVMSAIQDLRRQAMKSGTLKSNDQIKVTEKDDYITIEARDPQRAVYVPQYNPWLVYGYPITPWPGWVEVPGLWWNGPGINFGLSFGLGPWWGWGWGWPVWGMNWYGRGIWFNRRPWFGRGPAFFNRYNYYRGYPGFASPLPSGRGSARGYVPPARPAPGFRSGPFRGYNFGGNVRNFSAHGQGSLGGGFRGGGFRGGGFGRR